MFNCLAIQVKVTAAFRRSQCARFYGMQATIAAEYSIRRVLPSRQTYAKKEGRSINMRLCGTDVFTFH